MVVVVQWSDASYVEDQDHWWQAGIQRDVFLYMTPKSYIQDVFAIGDLSEDFEQGLLDVTIELAFASETKQPVPEQYSLAVELFDAAGTLVVHLTADSESAQQVKYLYCTVQLHASVPKPNLWSAKSPYLYTLSVTLRTPDGQEQVSTQIGFCNIRIENRQLLINSKAVLIKGVN